MHIVYKSTRSSGEENAVSFEDVVMIGLSPDNGLFVPSSIPCFSIADIEKVSVIVR